MTDFKGLRRSFSEELLDADDCGRGCVTSYATDLGRGIPLDRSVPVSVGTEDASLADSVSVCGGLCKLFGLFESSANRGGCTSSSVARVDLVAVRTGLARNRPLLVSL